MRRPYLLLLLAAVLALSAALIKERPAQERLSRAAAMLQHEVDVAAADLERRVQQAFDADSIDMSKHEEPGEGGLRLYRAGVVTAWNDHTPISDSELGAARESHLHLPDGVYLHAFKRNDQRAVHGLRRVLFAPPFHNRYMQQDLDPGFKVEKGITAKPEPGLGPVVRDAKGVVMLRLEWPDDDPLPGDRSLVSLLLALLAIGAAVGAGWLFAARLKDPWVSIVVFVVPLLALRYATLLHGGFEALEAYPLFDPSLYASSVLAPSLGHLLINTAVLLCAAAFFQQALRRGTIQGDPWIGATIATLALVILAGQISSVIIGLVRDSRVGIDLFRVQDFDVYGVAALVSVGFLLMAWCLVSDALVRRFAAALGPWKALLLAAAACLVVFAARWPLGVHDPVPAIWPLAALWLLYGLHMNPGALRVVLLIAVLAFFTAHTINRQTFKRLQVERATMAENATTHEDPVIELLFGEAKREMQHDEALLEWIRRAPTCSASELDRMVRQPFLSGYWDRYDVRLHLVDTLRRTFCSTSPEGDASTSSIVFRFEQGVPVDQAHNLRVTLRPGEDALYMGRVALGTAQLYIELLPRLVVDGLGFPDLLLNQQQATAPRMARYARARYERGSLASSSGEFVFPITWKDSVPAQGLRWDQSGFDLLALGDPHGTLVVLGLPIPTTWDHVTTFSYLFLFYCIMAALVAALLLAFHKPASLAIGVSTKVRLGVAGFAVISLLLFAFGMRQMTVSQREHRIFRNMAERTRGVLTELRHTLRGEERLPPSAAPYIDHLLENLSNVFFTDLSLYAPDGTLFATSREQVFSSGLLGRRMHPLAYQRLAQERASWFVNREHIGDAEFSTAYMPFRNDNGQVLGYLALPYFARQGEVEQWRASSFVALVNLFTLLFLLSVVAAALITHWTTRPLELLRRGLERIGLGASNQPIPYSGNDELGQLVQVYNRKVEELRESADKLARSERESAWREMARQVAHEIKNPLTPMKLNIQLFQQSWNPDLPDAQERLERLSQGLIEQINALSRIAEEFSDFAKMPRAQPEGVDLHQVAAAAVALFAAEPGAEVSLHPGEPLPVRVDREHLMRVFTNLIKNALQAMPTDRRARIELFTHSEGGQAVVEVRDNGSGIAEADRERIFQPSFTTKSSGMGLGLALVQRMVENAGGRVWFTTAIGQGTSFFVALPLEQDPALGPDAGD